jgi:hypothetical protein
MRPVHLFNSCNSLCISLDFSPPISIFNFEKHWFQLIISHSDEFRRIQLLKLLSTNSFRKFSLWCSIKSWNRGYISPVTSQVAPLLTLKTLASPLPHNAVDSLMSWIETWNSHLNT